MRDRNERARRGGALVSALIVVLVLTALAAAVFTATIAQKKEIAQAGHGVRALYLAEAGISESLIALAGAREQRAPPPTDVGTPVAPRSLKSGRYWGTIVDNGDGTYTVTTTGATTTATERLVAIVGPSGGSAFDHAIFAGNSSGDPAYTLSLGGTGVQADRVTGDVYSGGNVHLRDDSSVNGNVYATGSIAGTGGDGGVVRPIPDIAGMSYAVNNDFDVAALFASATWAASPRGLGGRAWQMPESSPVHVFRKNPDDRITETSSTAKDDYFLEDPYMPTADFKAWNGKDGHTLTLAGNGNDRLYYIDGNLWVHNKPFGRLRLDVPGDAARITFVVRGNVYFSDDVLLEDNAQAGVAFIAVKDPNLRDSGNIFLGDPRYGTLERMDAFLYAENDFYDLNLSATGSAVVDLNGNMTAGNHVSIRRDFLDADGVTQHSRLTVRFDDRLSTGALVLPGIPRARGPSAGGFAVRSWRTAALQ